jgi:glycosyltransferase involved in cell wall biosynthesis
MANDLARRGIRPERMTPVPMGIDLSQVPDIQGTSATVPPELAGRRVIAYLGTLDRARRLDFLLEAFAEVRTQIADAVLLLVGKALEPADEAWLRSVAEKLHVDDATVWTGWLPTTTAWSYLRHADVAVSIVPRGELFDWASPTKVVEYLALGIPVVANDQPDQHRVLTESGAGISVAMDVHDLSHAILRILKDASLAERMSQSGPPYVAAHRSYALIGKRVASVYHQLWSDTG